MDERWKELIKDSLHCETYREFLGCAFKDFQTHSKSFNYSSFSRKAGFTSRSFVKEVLEGKKRITSRSLPGFIRALSLPFYLRNYFTLLVTREEQDIDPQGLSPEELESKLLEARERLKERLVLPSVEKGQGELLSQNRAVGEIYALIGKRKSGITFEKLCAQAPFQPAVVRRIVEALKIRGIVSEQNGLLSSYRTLHVEQGAGDKHPLKATFLSMVDSAKEQAEKKFASPEHLFLHAVFTIDSRRMPELKAKLWELMKEFVEENMDEEGQTTSKLILALFK